jgi:hypothetical protein
MLRRLALWSSLNLLVLSGVTVLGLAVPDRPAWAAGKGAVAKTGKKGDALAETLAQGEQALKNKDFDGALRIFRDAYREDPDPRLLYHLGAVAAARGQSVEARDLLRRFLADPNVEPADPLRAEAQKLLDGLVVQPAGEVMVNAPRGALIEADGRLLGVAPLSLPLLLPAGAHQIAVQQGKWRGTSDAKVPTGRQLEVRFKSGADVAVVTLPPGVVVLDETPDAASAGPLNQAVEATLKRENYATVPRATALTYGADLAGCLQQPTCQQKLAARFEADLVLQLKVRRDGAGPSAHWTLGLQLLDVESGVSAGEQRATCDSCTTEQAARKLGEVTSALVRSATSRARAVVEVTTEPSGAEVLLSGRLLGKAPVKKEVPAGRYSLEVRLAGHAPKLDTVEVEGGKPLRLSVNLEPDGSEPSPVRLVEPVVVEKPRRPVWCLATGGALLGAGVLVSAFGIGALVATGQCADLSTPDPTTGCPNGRFDSSLQSLGIGLTTVGVLAAVGGAVLIALPPRKPAARQGTAGKTAALGLGLRSHPGAAVLSLTGAY